MSLTALLSRRAWIALMLAALGFLFWSDSRRVERLQQVTNAVPTGVVVAAGSPTGYEGGIRNLILPEQNSGSAHWIVQTQQMFAQREWRVRQVGYENAPLGRAVFAPSPYRWWLGLVAWMDHHLSGRPMGLSVEHAALWADPILHSVLLLCGAVFVARFFGTWPAALFSVAVVLLFPFATLFSPGAPDERALSRTLGLLSVLVLLAGIRFTDTAKSGRFFCASGVLGALGLWVSVADQVPVILGSAMGGILAVWTSRKAEREAWLVRSADWLAWSVSGASAVLAFYLVEYFPSHLGGWRLDAIHPLYGIAWLGLGVGVALTVELRRTEGARWSRWWIVIASVFAVAAIAVVPLFMVKADDAGFLASELWSLRLTKLSLSVEATSLWAWLARDGFTTATISAVLPLFIIAPAVGLFLRKNFDGRTRAALCVTFGAVAVGAWFAISQIGRWGGVQAMLLALMIVVTMALNGTVKRRLALWLWSLGVALMLIPGGILLLPPGRGLETVPLNGPELAGMISRDLAHWLARRVGTEPTIVLAPPDETMALSYYGGLRGVGTLSRENEAGIGAAVRIFGAMTPQEAFARLQQREVTHVVVPSWNRYLDEYVRLGVVKADDSFLAGLRNWAPIPWLKPVPYQLPAVAGYEGQHVAVFEVVEEQNETTILSWQAEYFAELGRMDYAAALGESLKRFPTDLGALIARGQVAMAQQNARALADVVKGLAPRMSSGAVANLAWDRRIGLAAVLAQGKQPELAREQIRRCIDQVTEKRLRGASGSSLYRLLVLAKAFGFEIGDPELRELALELLPAEWRAQL